MDSWVVAILDVVCRYGRIRKNVFSCLKNRRIIDRNLGMHYNLCYGPCKGNEQQNQAIKTHI